ncbi:MAG: C40 family peptidase [Ferruginibacter sp.]|nr:C40 family peptidase [Chitinophagaceae bacterium]
MVKKILPAIAFIVLLSSCNTFKQLSFTNNRQATSQASVSHQAKFIDDISVTPQITVDKTAVKPEPTVKSGTTRGMSFTETPAEKQEENKISELLAARIAEVEMVTQVQLKYAALLNTQVESLPCKALLESVDEWYGVRYRKGGNTKTGIDCSGFTEAVYASAYGIMLPPVSREQYRISTKISTTDLQEGDLVFFNTTGGISHVGIYLGNNKFIHATVSRGVMVNGLFEPYYLKRYLGAGRIESKQTVSN